MDWIAGAGFLSVANMLSQEENSSICQKNQTQTLNKLRLCRDKIDIDSCNTRKDTKDISYLKNSTDILCSFAYWESEPIYFVPQEEQSTQREYFGKQCIFYYYFITWFYVFWSKSEELEDAVWSGWWTNHFYLLYYLAFTWSKTLLFYCFHFAEILHIRWNKEITRWEKKIVNPDSHSVIYKINKSLKDSVFLHSDCTESDYLYKKSQNCEL